MRRSGVVIAAIAGLAGPAPALERLDGYFIAFEACEAFQSKNKQTNPGDVLTEPFRAYEMIAINKPGGDYFQMAVPGAPVTADRWVHASCGVHVIEAGTPVTGTPPVVVTPPAGSESAVNVLALSWQPAFCETKPNKAECLDLNAGVLPVTERQLSIHGLWAQPEGKAYCGVPEALVALDRAAKWSDLPEAGMDAETRELLDVAMPGTASFLERHEWIKHGTCHLGAGGADEYFDDTLRLAEAVNGAVGAFLADHVGAEVQTADIRARFDAAFGPGAGERVQVHCAGDGGRVLVQELKISLRGVIGPDASPAELLLAAEPLSPGCPAGVIDAAGLQ
jgi:ribonuclease T2